MSAVTRHVRVTPSICVRSYLVNDVLCGQQCCLLSFGGIGFDDLPEFLLSDLMVTGIFNGAKHDVYPMRLVPQSLWGGVKFSETAINNN